MVGVIIYRMTYQNSILQNGATFNYHHSDDTDTYIISVSNLILPNLYMYSFVRNFITFHSHYSTQVLLQ